MPQNSQKIHSTADSQWLLIWMGAYLFVVVVQPDKLYAMGKLSKTPVLYARLEYTLFGFDFIGGSVDIFADRNKERAEVSVVITETGTDYLVVEAEMKTELDKKGSVQLASHLARLLTEHASAVHSLRIEV